MTQFGLRLNNRRRLALYGLIGAILLLNIQVASAQTLSPMSGGKADECSGPLGALLPECQAKSSIDVPSTLKMRGLPSSPDALAVGSTGEPTPPAPAPAPAQAAAPDPPSEFQRFVASSVGRILPIFGASLFERVPTTFAPLDRVPVTADYVIGPGDEILLRVWGQLSWDLKLTVDRAGAVYLPQVGNVTVSGIQFKQLSDYLRSQLERVFRNFDLSVNMGQLRSIQIFVMGQARRPGTYTVSSLSTLVNALFASGGPSAQGSMRRIQLKRGAAVAAELDIYDLLLRGDKSGDVRLLPEDVIYIPPVGSQVAATGSVRSAAIYELKAEKTIGELIQMTGGLIATADRQRAILERIKGSTSREVIELSLSSDGMNTLVADGDVLQVLTITPRFESSVTLRGNVANPGRFRWKAGMRLRDIIPDMESLITRDYWKKRNVLGYVSAEEAASADPASEAQRKPKATGIGVGVPDINWSYAVIERQNPQDLMTKLIPFDPGKLVQQNDASQNLELQSGDVVTIFSQGDIRVPQRQQTRTIRLEGELNAPGVYNVGPGETLGQIIQKAGGLTPQAYLYGAEFMRESVRKDQQLRLDQYIQDLEKEIEQTATIRMGTASTAEESTALAVKVQNQRQMAQRLRSMRATGRIVLNLVPESNDLAAISGMSLEDQDRFMVPARPATVQVLGEVYNQNALMHAPKQRVSDYLRQAGGPTRNADESRMYIIQADGTILPRQDQRFGLFKASFTKTRLNPGDAIVVPEHVFKTTFMNELREWSQIFFQFGLTAAAINVFR